MQSMAARRVCEKNYGSAGADWYGSEYEGVFPTERMFALLQTKAEAWQGVIAVQV